MIIKEEKRPFPPLATTFILILLLWLAFALRLHNLDAFSFWTDEGLTPLRSSYPITEILSNRIIIQEGITRDTHPPLFYLIIHFTRQLFGDTDFAFRYPSVLAGVLLLPLLYQFGRRLNGRSLGLLTALLLAINPLHVWYAKEARMYTLFVLLVAAATYQLWRVLTSKNFWRPLLLYILFASLAVYTHYTAVFIFALQSLFLVSMLWQRGYKKLIIGMAVFAVLAAIPLIPFTIPRLFTGAEANYYYVSPYTMLQDVVHFFGLGMSVDFQQIGIKLLDAATLLLLIIGVIAARSWRSRLYLLTYLLAVVFGLMAGSLLKPMYQGVRHIMVGSPAFVLLLAWGIVGLRSRTSGIWRGITVSLAMIALLLGSFVSLSNLFFNPDYAKDDFRALARYIDLHAGDNDIVIYNNAIFAAAASTLPAAPGCDGNRSAHLPAPSHRARAGANRIRPNLRPHLVYHRSARRQTR
ncbi:MAG: glycosyltransferase family 39 protein [Chloroflexota bacterium]